MLWHCGGQALHRESLPREFSNAMGLARGPGIAERQLGIRESRTINNADLALGDPRKAFRATVSLLSASKT